MFTLGPTSAVFGSKGVLMYGGDDKNPSSGRLELRRHDGSESHISEGFLMENTEQRAPRTAASRILARARERERVAIRGYYRDPPCDGAMRMASEAATPRLSRVPHACAARARPPLTDGTLG